MLSSILSAGAPLLLLFSHLPSTNAAPTSSLLSSPRDANLEPFDSCTTYPAWTVQKFTSFSSDSVGGGSVGAGVAGPTASFLMTNSLTGTTDEVTCKLQVNYRCIVQGVKSDKNVTVHIAIRARFVELIVDEVVAGCPGRETPLHVIAREDVEINCSWDDGEEAGGPVACVQALEEDILQGEAVELAPG